MSDIDELQERVEAVEQSFGSIDEQYRKFGDCLVGLLSTVEARLREKQAEIGRLRAEIEAAGAHLESVSQKKERLSALLLSLLVAVEGGGGDRLGKLVHDIEAKVSALVESDGAKETPAQADRTSAPCEAEPVEASEPEDDPVAEPENAPSKEELAEDLADAAQPKDEAASDGPPSEGADADDAAMFADPGAAAPSVKDIIKRVGQLAEDVARIEESAKSEAPTGRLDAPETPEDEAQAVKSAAAS